ncbi:hypothetical protein PI124_g7199 [Phytophthora idaei]|nr:hypothetical protein PI125_g6777 [Phytophthora idaei]KAG3248084.1 hypothetical protein PI124_g7199 [Phytophthora idaei]
MLVEQNELNGWHIALHVGAASGDFIAPFINPELQWDFRLPKVKSINVSGHKFGLGGRCTVCYGLVTTDAESWKLTWRMLSSYVKLWWTLISSISSTRRTCRWWLSRSRTRLLTRVSTSSRAVTIMRVVAKQNSSCQTAKMLVQDILHAVAALEQHSRMQHASPAKTSMITSSVAVTPMPAL